MEKEKKSKPTNFTNDNLGINPVFANTQPADQQADQFENSLPRFTVIYCKYCLNSWLLQKRGKIQF